MTPPDSLRDSIMVDARVDRSWDLGFGGEEESGMVEREVFCLGKQSPSGATWAEWRDGMGMAEAGRWTCHGEYCRLSDSGY
jgi:hypothetical protein